MSYILDALKKIEHEKSKKANPGGRNSISGDLFQERKQPAARTGIWKITLLIVVVSLVTCAATWFVLQGKGKKRPAVVRLAAPPLPAPVNLPSVAPVVSVPVSSSPAAVAVPPAAAPVAQGSSEAGSETVSPARGVRRSKKQGRPQPASPQQPAQTVPAPADIKLSGIAWQDDHSARRAVVNGFLLKEGAVVSGAKITDIQADRVRFLSAAGAFEIKLDAVLPAGAHQ